MSELEDLRTEVARWKEIAGRLAVSKMEMAQPLALGLDEWSEAFELIGICGKCKGQRRMPCECTFDSTSHNDDVCDRCGGTGKSHA